MQDMPLLKGVDTCLALRKMLWMEEQIGPHLLDIFGKGLLTVPKGQLAGSCYRKGVGNKRRQMNIYSY